jgi:exosome complex component RRP42
MQFKFSDAEYINDLLSKGLRENRKGVSDYRDIKIQTNKIPNAEGSAQVDIGNTRVLVGVKVAVGEPLPDHPDEGALVTSADLLPIASPNFEPGPPTSDAIEFARVVDRGIRAAEVLDTEALFIEKDKVWTVFVDIYVLNYDGNIFDAATMGAMAALKTARMPKYENEEVIREGNLGKLPTKGFVTSCTFGKVGDKLLIDPTGSEENVMTSRLTVAVDDAENIRAMQKGLRGSFTTEEVNKIIDETFEKSKQLRDIVKKSIGE